MSTNTFQSLTLNETSILLDQEVIPYNQIQDVSIQNEQASFRGKSKPFTHTVLAGTTFLCGTMEPQFYVALKITLRDHTIRAAYISNRKTGYNTDIFHEDTKEAKTIKKLIEKHIQ